MVMPTLKPPRHTSYSGLHPGRGERVFLVWAGRDHGSSVSMTPGGSGPIRTRLGLLTTTACIDRFPYLALFHQGSTSPMGCGRGEMLPGNCDIAK